MKIVQIFTIFFLFAVGRADLLGQNRLCNDRLFHILRRRLTANLAGQIYHATSRKTLTGTLEENWRNGKADTINIDRELRRKRFMAFWKN